MLFMASGNNLISIYVALELMALSSYVLAGYFKAEPKSTEAALKYFILGAFSSGVLLYGLSLVYGVGGVMGLPELAKLLESASRSNLLMLGILLILAGLLFKIAAVPFHVWTPDVYEGSPTPVTAFFSVGPKVAAYAILARIFYVAFPKFHADWGFVVALVSAATMVLGNVAALLQSNVKRMLAYSSIANAGYALLGVLGFRTEWGLWGILIYLLAYTFMNFGAFTLIILLESKGYAGESVSDFNGLAKRSMPAAVVMLLFLLSLAGIPPTAGFIGKYYLFTAAMKAGYAWLAILAVVMSAVSLFYYFRIASAMFFADGAAAELKSSYALTAVIAVCAAGTLVIGIAPQPFLEVLKSCVLR
jgi:NADH-quinone oxidoreductase subunit N